ncbi:hypothetical protein GM418_10430 [Maribellus comscasis]|uniref:Calcineurin-like phosphoesterase domain-containing protein n=1 Tax=Maribellus comscasis TaxID=2681766 RepID=A0A6I6JSK3_9BACT|nr:metallophosphoesterase [Maribellus comscasis]QGY44058.1 hypothetical protein GM418_10430 [Maribellus comscasis]
MKRFFPLIFLLLFLAIIAGANIYLSRRFNFYFAIENTRLLYLAFPATTAFMVFGMMPLSNSTKRWGNIIYMLAAIVMGVLLYLILSVLLVEAVNIFAHFSPKNRGILALAITSLVSVYGVFNAWNVQVTQQEIGITGLSKEIRIMHLSDIHIGHFRGKIFLEKIVRKVNRQNVDAVFITGDLFDGVINLSKESLAPLTDIHKPIFFVEGNHDKYSGVQMVKNYLTEINIHVLENEIYHWNGLQIIGLNHMAADSETFNIHTTGQKNTIKSTLESLSPDKSKPTLLLHHSPDGIQYASNHGVDLYLAGHTHAGQLFPIKYIAGLIFQYNKGLHSFNETKLFVSQGAGTFGPPMRVGTKSEITRIHLKPIK